MVGVPRSKGCRICVQRRVRCDLTRPICNNCRKGNRPCPGYDSDLRIHDEGSKLRKRFAQKDAAETKLESDNESPSTSVNSQSTESSPEESMELVTRSPLPTSNTIAIVPRDGYPRNPFIYMIEKQIYPDSDPSSLRMTAADFAGLFNAGSKNRDMNNFSRPFLPPSVLMANYYFLVRCGPIRPGSPNSLAYLVPTFSTPRFELCPLIHLGRVQQSDVFVQESRQFYGKALRLLNKSLSEDADGMSTETLSATILLSFYEMFASDSNQSWVHHAGGAGMLMRIRGPARHLSGVDRDVYLAYRHTIVIEAFMRDEACFLAEPQWLEMATKIHTDLRLSGIPDGQLEIFDLAEEFYIEHTAIPGILKDSKNLSEAQLKMSPDQYAAHKDLVLAQTRLHRANLKSLNLRVRAALKKQGIEAVTMRTMDPVFPKQYVFVNVFVASTHIGHWTIMVILNLILMHLEKDIAPEKHALYLIENLEMCREICRTTPFMLTSSFMGPFFAIFALRLCLLVFEPGQERDWVVRKLTQIGNTHMKMASDIPDFDPKQNFTTPDIPMP